MSRRFRPERSARSAPRVGIALVLLAPWLAAWSFFDPFHEHVEKGNRSTEASETEAALQHYDEAARVDPSSPIPDYNRGLAQARDGDTESALDSFKRASAAGDASIAADALFNEGNVHLEAEQYEPAIDSYLRSLDLDPEDPDARRNLEIALQKLQEQQQQQQQQEQQQDQESDDEQDQEQEPQDPSDESQDEEQEQQPQPDDSRPEEEEAPQEPQPQPQEDRLSREDAERLLNAVQSDELQTLEQLQEQQVQPGVVVNDW